MARTCVNANPKSERTCGVQDISWRFVDCTIHMKLSIRPQLILQANAWTAVLIRWNEHDPAVFEDLLYPPQRLCVHIASAGLEPLDGRWRDACLRSQLPHTQSKRRTGELELKWNNYRHSVLPNAYTVLTLGGRCGQFCALGGAFPAAPF